MAVNHYINHESKVIITTLQGNLTPADCILMLKEYQHNIQCHEDYVDYNEVFDVSDAVINLTISGLLELGRVASKTDHLFVHKKLAFIVGTAKSFTLARMYQVYRNMGENSSKEISVFTSKDEAILWAQNND